MVKLKKKLQKDQEKKLEIKRTNWIEGLNWNLINFYKRANAKKKFKRMRTKLETILFDKLEFKD